ncbi:5625_t:CDS:2 [Funneliformis caledonium]|uniref:5625_t:CDS:1 n=1 Tax=Funneliformis caledonium TaxID=1117310 RepID=A0A9N9B7N1_9GLOM|nr:5625_t:CDS:2 [Funneliformis caledonium]
MKATGIVTHKITRAYARANNIKLYEPLPISRRKRNKPSTTTPHEIPGNFCQMNKSGAFVVVDGNGTDSFAVDLWQKRMYEFIDQGPSEDSRRRRNGTIPSP